MNEKKVQLLVATMNQKDDSLIKKMNIQSDAIICNQCDRTSKEYYEYGGYHITYFNSDERGVGLNRNNALMRATGDICVLADDDMIFYDGYRETVEKAFAEYHDTDMIVFNIDDSADSARRKNTEAKKVHMLNYMNYGAARLAFRRKAVTYNGISFNLNFGGGTAHNAGEDTLFIRDCLRAGLKITAVPVSIACLTDSRDSSWFEGYNEKYFVDKGIVLAIAHPVLARLMALYMAVRYRRIASAMDRKEILKAINKGISFFKNKDFIK